MIEHRAAVRERLVDQEADRLRKLNLSRDQILARLWELATLSHEAIRGSIAGQIKALSMIVAIEGLIPDRRSFPSGTQPVVPPVEADIYNAAWLRKQQHQAACGGPDDPVAATEAQTAAPLVPDPEPTPKPATPRDPDFGRNFDRKQSNLPGPLIPHGSNWGSPRDKQRLRCCSGHHQLVETALFPQKKPLWPASLKSKKSQILSNFIKDKVTAYLGITPSREDDEATVGAITTASTLISAKVYG
jgi:hypothetical protein